MNIIQTKAIYNDCEKCDYKWVSRVDKPKQCPNCKSMKWAKKTADKKK